MQDVGLAPASVGLVLAVTAVGGVVGAAVLTPLVRHLGDARTLVVCKAGAGPCALLVPLAAPGRRLGLFVAGSTLVVVVVGVTAGNVVSGSFRQRYVPTQLIGRVLTSMQVVNCAGIPLGAVAGGVLATVAGTRAALAVLVVAYTASGLLLVRGPLRGVRDLPAGRHLAAGSAGAAASLQRA